MTAPATLDDLNRMANGFQQAKVLLLGVVFNVFDHVHAGRNTAATIAEAEQSTLRGIEILLNSLCALGLLSKHGDHYENAPVADRYLRQDTPTSVVNIMAHRNQMFRSWAKLDETIRMGKQTSEREKATLTNRKANRNFILGMAEVSRDRIAPVLDALPLETCTRFVDLGGGPGQYVCAAVERNPGIQALLVDLPLTVEVAREQIVKRGLTHKVEAVACDFYHDPLPEFSEPADIVLISQVFHAEGPEQNLALLKKIEPRVRPGGVVCIVENLVNEDHCSPWGATMFAVNMLAGTQRGRTYTEQEISSWLREAGFFPSPAAKVADRAWLILARKPQ